MRILLAGYNIDTEVLKELLGTAGDRADATPETLSAAYARISRSPKPVDELRRLARKEVEKARRSNQNIIFGMGHHSVAEHAVFNFDIIGVSRLAIEEIEKFRLNAYTEKSQRYITLENDFVVPAEVGRSGHKGLFVETVRQQNRLYHTFYEALKKHVFEKHPDLARERKNHPLLEGWAKEDARYVTSLATEGQLGATLNARNLELLFRRFASHELAEVREIGAAMFQHVEHVAPSLLLFKEANDFDRGTYPELRAAAREVMQGVPEVHDGECGEEVRLVGASSDADEMTVASLLHRSTTHTFNQCLQMVREMTQAQKEEFIKRACQYMELYDSTLREFEYVDATFELILSASCFAQLKRHRLVTLTCQSYDPRLGVTIPDSIREIGLEGPFREIMSKTENTFATIKADLPSVAPYVLTNAHRKRVLLKANARELYHMSRLRLDATAQWDIRRLVGKVIELAKEVMPLTLLLAGGKDAYPELYQKVFGHPPKVIEAKLPS